MKKINIGLFGGSGKMGQQVEAVFLQVCVYPIYLWVKKNHPVLQSVSQA